MSELRQSGPLGHTLDGVFDSAGVPGKTRGLGRRLQACAEQGSRDDVPYGAWSVDRTR